MKLRKHWQDKLRPLTTGKPIDKVVRHLVVRLRNLFRTDSVYVAGGYPTYLMGLTTTYENVDVWVATDENVNKLYNMADIMWKPVDNLNFPHTSSATYEGFKFKVIFTEYAQAPVYLTEEFDMVACCNVLWFNGIRWCSYHRVGLKKYLALDRWRPEYTIPVRGWLQEARRKKYAARYIIPSLQTMTAQILKANALYPFDKV